MSNIAGNGASQAIYLRMNGTAIERSVGTLTTPSTWVAISSWPVTIYNTNPIATAILNVVVTENLTISSSTGGTSGYFRPTGSYITFNGAGFDVTISNNITSYPGFIQNGTSTANGQANVVVKNFTMIKPLAGGSISENGGVVCQSYFGRGVSGNSIENCTNQVSISSTGAGGIAGAFAGYSGGSVTFTGCTNSGASGQYTGGIAGRYAGYSGGSVTFTDCTNSGVLNQSYSAGIAGYGAGSAINAGITLSGHGSATFINCTNTSSVSGTEAGGIAGGQAGSSTSGLYNGSATFINCRHTGLIQGTYVGGIAGRYAGSGSRGSATFTGCTNSGKFVSGSGDAGGIAGADAGSVTFTDCTNNGDFDYITGSENKGGIAGPSAGAGSGNSATFTNCTNTGTIDARSSGGIAGAFAGAYSGSVTFTDCLNTGNNNDRSAQSTSGIAGPYAGYSSGSATFTGCTNTGTIGGEGFGGGIAGPYAGGNAGSATFTGCTNTGVAQYFTGGIAGGFAGTSGSATFTDCLNTGVINGSASGIAAGGAGGSFGGPGGSVTFTNCTNTGTINGAGGIAGSNAGSNGGSATFTGCSNTGAVARDTAGGIAGYGAGTTGSATITGCLNSGAISGPYAGGIAGQSCGYANGSITIDKCFNTGDITGQYAGGIAGSLFARNTSQPCSITNSYSTGAISGDRTGGIVGASVGYSNNAIYTAQVSITNSYSLGAIATTCGGICGGWDNATYTNKASVNITNTYSFGALAGTGTGLVAVSLTSTQINLTTTNTYVAAGSWTDASANANLTSTPTETGIAIGQATTWTSLSVNVPYLLSTFFSLTGSEIVLQIYTPNSISTADNGNSVPGLYQPGVYNFANTSQVGNTFTAKVYAINGTTPIYYGYGYTTYSVTNTNGSSSRPITATINGTTGVISFILPYPCFLEGTKILCFENNQEVYRPVESLRKGDLVKTIYNGYLPIHMIGTSPMYNPNNDDRIASRLYKCSKENYPALFEDLYITGCHSILVPWLTYVQGQMTIATLGNIFVTDKHCRLMAWVDQNAEPYTKGGMYNIYHIALENDDYYMNYGIYANGLLVESCSKRYLTEMSNMRVVGEEDSRVKESETPTETLFPNMTNLIESC